MSELIRLLPTFALMFAVVGLLWLIAWKVGALDPKSKSRWTDAAEEPRRSDAPEEARRTNAAEEPLAYRIHAHVLTDGERALFPALRESVEMLSRSAAPPRPLLLLASVRAANVLDVDSSRSADRSRWQSAFNRLSGKQFDFVICDGESTRPLLVIELDDRTHARPDRQARDSFIDAACATADLPILHIPAARLYNAPALAAEIRKLLH